jgi:hypothetical protein
MVVEGGAIGLRCIRSPAPVRDEPVERQTSVTQKLQDFREILVAPFRGDADARFAHERWRKRETERGAIESGQHDLAAGRQPRDELIEQVCIATDIIDRAVVSARIVIGRDNGIAASTAAAVRTRFPHGRGLTAGHEAEPGEETSKHAVTDDEIGLRPGAQRVLRGRGKGQKDGRLAPSLIDGCGALSWHDNSGSGTAKKAAHILEAFGARNEDTLALANPSFGSGR